MPTSPVTAVVSGASFSVNVAAADLDAVLTIRDYVVLENGTLTLNPLSYTKSTQTSIQYSGPALAANTNLEIRRSTPRSVRQVVLPGTKVRATDWNLEFDRRVRIQEEMDVYGAGGGFSVRLPLDTAYGVAWSTDALFSPTRKALYNQMETYAPKVSPVFTGVPVAPTPLTSDNSTTLATTAYVKSNLGLLAPLASPAFTGSPTVPTAATADNSTLVANTAFVTNRINSLNLSTTYAPLVSPGFTGTPTVPQPNDGVKTAQIASMLNLQRHARPIVIARRTTPLNLTAGVWSDIGYDAIRDSSSVFGGGVTFTAPYTGLYEFSGYVTVNNSSFLILSLCIVTGTEVARLSSAFRTGGGFLSTNGVSIEFMNAGDTRKFMVQSDTTTTTFADTSKNANYCNIKYLGIDSAT